MRSTIKTFLIYILAGIVLIVSTPGTYAYGDEAVQEIQSGTSAEPLPASDSTDPTEPPPVSDSTDPTEPSPVPDSTDPTEPSPVPDSTDPTEPSPASESINPTEPLPASESNEHLGETPASGSTEPSGEFHASDSTETSVDIQTPDTAETSGISEPEESAGAEDKSNTVQTAPQSGEKEETVSADNAASDTQKSSVSADKTVSEPNAVSVSSDMITSIEPYSIEKLELEYKPALFVLTEQLPRTITIHKGDEAQEIETDWMCRDNYDEYLGEYPFVPVLDGYKLADDLEIPAIKVTFVNEGVGNIGGSLRDETDYDAPLAGSRRKLRSSANPSSYNACNAISELENVPQIRNQNPYGTCWSFSTIGAIETDLIHDDPDIDLSELHLAYYASHNYKDPKELRKDSLTAYPSYAKGWLNNGGDVIPGFRMLANLIGAVKETDAPYGHALSYSPGDDDVISKDYAQIRNAYVINVEEKDAIKSAIRYHGSVSAAYYESSGSEYSGTYNSYYAPICYSVNHAVMLVGWDDKFPKENFNTEPGGDGAWLVRNSWGYDNFGHSGYFWMSYYDAGFIRSGYVVAFDASLDTYENCYAYDGQPLDNIFYLENSGTVVTETYKVQSGEAIKAIGFEIDTANVTADITVTNEATGESQTASCSTAYAGFYTAELSDPLIIQNDSDIEVSIKYTASDGGTVRVVCENTREIEYGSVRYKGVHDGHSKVAGYSIPYDLRMKVYSDSHDISSSGDIKLEETQFSGHWKQTAQIGFASDSRINDMSKISWSSSNDRVAKVDGNGLITFGAKKGTARLKGVYSDSGNTETVWCTATVLPYEVTYHITDDTLTNSLNSQYDPSTHTVKGEFYPGDYYNSGLLNALRTGGYYASDWYKDSTLTESSKVSWHPENCEDLVLWPKWEEMKMTIRYYAPNSALNGYSVYLSQVIKADIPASKLPYTLPGASGCTYNPDTYTTEYNKNNPPKAFSYWSADAAGRNKVTQITADAFNVRYEGGCYYTSLDTYLYPQYAETGEKVSVTGVGLNKTSLSMTAGQGVQLTATVVPSNATNKNVIWSSSNTSAVRVSSTGYVTAVGSGTANITVKTADGGKTAVCKITSRVPVTGVSLSKTSLTLTVGNGTQLTATIAPANASNKAVTWSSSNTSVAKVSGSGYVTAAGKGTAVITVKTADNSKTATCKVTSTVPVTGVSLSKTSLSLTKGQGAQITANITPSNAANKSVTWSSSNASVVTVSSSGYVTAKGVGSAVITVRTADGGKTAACKVAVSVPNVSVSYRTHVENIGWQSYVSNGAVAGTSGRSLRLEGINIYLSGNSNLGVQYTTHCQDYGWLGWSANNEMSGTEGESKRLEAIMINLTGADKDKYDIYYRVHAQDVGWMGWAKNGAAAGTAGYARRLEAIQIQVVKKNASINTNASGIYSVTSQAYISTGGGTPSVANSTIPNLSYRTHVQNVGWQSWKSNGQFSGTSGQSLRLEGINIKLSNKSYSGGIRYRTHVQNICWQDWKYDGAMSGTSGQSLRLEAINIELYGDMSKYYDIYYRVHAQDVGWMGWAKNGASSGTAGYSRRLEGIQIVIVNKGASAPGAGYGGISQNDSRAYISL